MLENTLHPHSCIVVHFFCLNNKLKIFVQFFFQQNRNLDHKTSNTREPKYAKYQYIYIYYAITIIHVSKFMLNFCNTLMKMLFITTITRVFGPNGTINLLGIKYTFIRIFEYEFKHLNLKRNLMVFYSTLNNVSFSFIYKYLK